MRFRDLLPWRDFAIETSWPPTLAAIEIKKRIAAPHFFGHCDKPFVGKAFTETAFRFSRAISYRNAFLPVIQATIEPSHGNAARVRVRMRLSVPAMAFMAIWMTGATFGALVGLVSAAGGSAAAMLALALPFFGAGLATMPFSLEADEAEAMLRAIFAPAPALPPWSAGEPYRSPSEEPAIHRERGPGDVRRAR
jgi:hypothetical protein